MYFFSPSTGQFYMDGVVTVPSDAIQLSDTDHFALVSGVNSGKQVSIDQNGLLVLVDRPPSAVPVPVRVTKFQAKAALHLAGLLDAVESLMADPATDRITRLAWSESLHFERRSPMIAAMSARLGLSETQVDDLFKSAAVIE